MTKKKVDLAFITNDSARKASFKKRKMGLIKKTAELSTLCGVQACAIIYSLFESKLVIWPSLKFKELSEMEQSNKMLIQDSYLRKQISKANEQLKKEKKQNPENNITQSMFSNISGNNLYNLSMADLDDIDLVTDQHMKDVCDKMDSLQITQKYRNITVGTSNVEDRHQLVHSPIDPTVHEAANQPGNWSMDPMNSQKGGHADGGLGVDGILGEEMVMSFLDTGNSDFNGSYSPGTF